MNPITLKNYEEWLVDYFDGKLSAQQINQLKHFIAEHPELAIELNDNEWPVLEAEDVKMPEKSNLKKNERTLQKRFDELCLKKIENITNDKEETELAEMLLQNPKHAEEWLMWLKTKLSIDVDIIYRWKSELFKNIEDATVTDREMFDELEAVQKNESKVKAWESNPLLITHWRAFNLSKIEADTTIVFPNKKQLKRSEGKVIPLFIYRSLALAASALLLFGIWWMLQPEMTTGEKKLADNTSKTINKSTAEQPSEKITESAERKPIDVLIQKKKDFVQKAKLQTINQPKEAENDTLHLVAQMDEMPYRKATPISCGISVPLLVSPLPVSTIDWSAAMAFDTYPTKNKSVLKKIWEFAGLPTTKSITPNSFNFSIDKKELTQTADLAIRKLSIGTLRLQQENGKNSIALNKELLKRQ